MTAKVATLAVAENMKLVGEAHHKGDCRVFIKLCIRQGAPQKDRLRYIDDIFISMKGNKQVLKINKLCVHNLCIIWHNRALSVISYV